MRQAMARKKPKAPYIPAVPMWDMGADGPANQANLVTEPAADVDLATGAVINPNGVKRNRRKWIVRKYHDEGLLTQPLFTAAERLFHAHQGQPTRDPLAAMTDRVDGGGCDDPNVTLFDARREFHRMMDKVPPECRWVVEAVVLNDTPISKMPGASSVGQQLDNWDALRRGLGALT